MELPRKWIALQLECSAKGVYLVPWGTPHARTHARTECMFCLAWAVTGEAPKRRRTNSTPSTCRRTFRTSNNSGSRYDSPVENESKGVLSSC
eukprot:847165-Amphidinium_carterae.1